MITSEAMTDDTARMLSALRTPNWADSLAPRNEATGSALRRRPRYTTSPERACRTTRRQRGRAAVGQELEGLDAIPQLATEGFRQKSVEATEHAEPF